MKNLFWSLFSPLTFYFLNIVSTLPLPFVFLLEILFFPPNICFANFFIFSKSLLKLFSWLTRAYLILYPSLSLPTKTHRVFSFFSAFFYKENLSFSNMLQKIIHIKYVHNLPHLSLS